MNRHWPVRDLVFYPELFTTESQLFLLTRTHQEPLH